MFARLGLFVLSGVGLDRVVMGWLRGNSSGGSVPAAGNAISEAVGKVVIVGGCMAAAVVAFAVSRKRR